MTQCGMSQFAARRARLRQPQRWAVLTLVLLALLAWAGFDRAYALQPISISPDQERLEITGLGEFFEGRGDNLQVETAPGLDGMAGRMSVRASTSGTNPSWIVFALRNATDKPVERWITAERYSAIGSGVVWPDLDARRLEALTPSLGFVPERVKSDRADIFRVTLEPGQTITYVAELSSERFARIYLWKPIDYELKARDRQLFNGINLGLVGLLAIFLTAVFAANHKVIVPATALVAWCVLGYLCVDFGFFHKLFQLKPEDNAVYRAATEAAMAASLVVFLYAFLRLGLWHGFIRVLVSAWIIAQLALFAVAVVDPRLAATFARASFALIGIIGLLFTLFLALRGQDRALALIPTWLLFLVWIFGAGVVVTGRLSGDVVVSHFLQLPLLPRVSRHQGSGRARHPGPHRRTRRRDWAFDLHADLRRCARPHVQLAGRAHDDPGHRGQRGRTLGRRRRGIGGSVHDATRSISTEVRRPRSFCDLCRSD